MGWVWRRGIGRAPPRAYLQADLDMVSPPGLAPADVLLCDAEAIRAVIEVGHTQHGSCNKCTRIGISQYILLMAISSSPCCAERPACVSLFGD